MNSKLADLFFAPIGLIADASRMVPQLAEQGRLQVNNARVMGRMATQIGSAKLAEHLGDLSGQVHELLERAGLVATGTDTVVPDGGPTRDAARADTPAEPTVAAAPSAAGPATDSGDVTSVDELAIVGYDSLAASQVVPRLAALRPDELEAVRRYELANRGRKTILGRVAQLQA